MSNGSIGPLVKADEFFNHQIVDTFATVSQSDYSWTEKVCGMAAARDGSLQVGFGFGKYPNRNVVDAYGGVGRQREQWTVRASRELARDPDTINAGPLEYEVIEPLKRIRIALAATDVQPIAWELELEGVVPCMLEDREDRRNLHGFRHTASQIRYHQTGTARGWVEVEGKRTEVRPSEWIMTRDHSWGIRPDVGVRIPDLGPDPMDGRVPSALAIWNPLRRFQLRIPPVLPQLQRPGLPARADPGRLRTRGRSQGAAGGHEPASAFRPGHVASSGWRVPGAHGGRQRAPADSRGRE
jgi:hypothetical protein